MSIKAAIRNLCRHPAPHSVSSYTISLRHFLPIQSADCLDNVRHPSAAFAFFSATCYIYKQGAMSYTSITGSLLPSHRHSLPTPKDDRAPTQPSYNTMAAPKYTDEKHTDAASVRSTSTMSSLKSLLHKKPQKTREPTKAQQTAERNLQHESRAVYFSLK